MRIHKYINAITNEEIAKEQYEELSVNRKIYTFETKLETIEREEFVDTVDGQEINAEEDAISQVEKRKSIVEDIIETTFFRFWTDEEKDGRTKRERISEIETKINQLKQQLSDMDYKTSKHADGEYTESEWQAIVAERQALRTKIKELEKDLESGNGG